SGRAVDSIQNEWVQVTVRADANTGLLNDDVFYFGNAIGDAGNHTADAQVTAQDELLARANPRNLVDNPAPIDFAYDYNRDRKVDAVDQLLARANKTTFETALQLIAAPAATPPAAAPAALSATAVKSFSTRSRPIIHPQAPHKLRTLTPRHDRAS